MKLRSAWLTLLVLGLTLVAVPAMAQVLYNNGPVNGTTDAWTINFGFVVSDTFPISSDSTTITGAEFAMWLVEGDTLESAQLSITSGENGGTSYFNQTVSFTQSGCSANQYEYDVCNESTVFEATLNTGTYWLNLQNGSVPSGDPVYWDQNFGGPTNHAWPQPLASENSVGTIPSESFTLMGFSSFPGKNGSPQSSTPEPSSILVLGSGILGVAAAWRLKIRR